MAKRNDLKVALLLDLDNFATGLKTAQNQSKQTATALDQAFSDLANKLTFRMVSVEAAMKVAEKAVKGFVNAAKEMEEEGTGNEGTAAVVRVSKALELLGHEVVKSIAGTQAFAVAASSLAGYLETTAIAVRDWDSALELADSTLEALKGSWAVVLADMIDAVTGFFSQLGKAIATGDPRAFGATPQPTQFSDDLRRSGEFTMSEAMKRYDALRATAAATLRREREEAARRKEKIDGANAITGPSVERGDGSLASALAEMKRRDVALASAARGTLDAFVSSWEGGFARLGDMFRGFSDELSLTLDGMSTATTQALGDTFDSVAFLGPMLQRVYGQSEAGARRFQAAQTAAIGAVAVVKGAMSLADAWDHTSKDEPGAAVASIAAAAGYATAAALAGASAAKSLTGGGTSAASGGIASSDQIGQERKSVTVVIQNAVGGEEFVRREVIPAINRAVRADEIVLATASQTAGSVDPGRFQT